jgi:hypothetical protein
MPFLYSVIIQESLLELIAHWALKIFYINNERAKKASNNFFTFILDKLYGQLQIYPPHPPNVQIYAMNWNIPWIVDGKVSNRKIQGYFCSTAFDKLETVGKRFIFGLPNKVINKVWKIVINKYFWICYSRKPIFKQVICF